jgi:hypothetical protein
VALAFPHATLFFGKQARLKVRKKKSGKGEFFPFPKNVTGYF